VSCQKLSVCSIHFVTLFFINYHIILEIFEQRPGATQLFSKNFIILGIVVLWLCFFILLFTGGFKENTLKLEKDKKEIPVKNED